MNVHNQRVQGAGYDLVDWNEQYDVEEEEGYFEDEDE